MKCEVCQKKIPSARLEVLPDTTRCVKCSNAVPVTEAGDYVHKLSEPAGKIKADVGDRPRTR